VKPLKAGTSVLSGFILLHLLFPDSQALGKLLLRQPSGDPGADERARHVGQRPD
jgi:hypothetical protein